jgi:hypothetical protein
MRDYKQDEKKEFDRSICFTFYESYFKQMELVEKNNGVEDAYNVCKSIIRYALYGESIEDDNIRMLVGESLLCNVDISQKRRSRSFGKEDLDMSEKIVTLHLDRPELSQDKIAKTLGISKGKVNRTLKKYAAGEYEGILSFSTDSQPVSHSTITSTPTSTITSTPTSTDRDRDRGGSRSGGSEEPKGFADAPPKNAAVKTSSECASLLRSADATLAKEREFKFDGAFDDKTIRDIILSTFERGFTEYHDDLPYWHEQIVDEFTDSKGCYHCNNYNTVSEYVDVMMNVLSNNTL